MIIGAIIVGIFILALMVLWAFFRERGGSSFDTGVVIGVVIMTLVIIEICLISNIIEKQKPSALDVYRGNTELEITYVNGTPIDTIVVFKKDLTQRH